jgi:hypothetical protein
LLQGGRREELATCEQIVQAADERREQRKSFLPLVVAFVSFVIFGSALLLGIGELCLFVRHFGARVAGMIR